MIAVDSNVLIAAHREEHSFHERSRALLIELGENEMVWGLPVFCVGEFLRVVTHPRVFTPPSDLTTVTLFIDRLLESPGVRLLTPGVRFWPILGEVLRQGDARGNLVFDGLIAALCIEDGATKLATRDRDFERFQDLTPYLP